MLFYLYLFLFFQKYILQIEKNNFWISLKENTMETKKKRREKALSIINKTKNNMKEAETIEQWLTYVHYLKIKMLALFFSSGLLSSKRLEHLDENNQLVNFGGTSFLLFWLFFFLLFFLHALHHIMHLYGQVHNWQSQNDVLC